MPAPRKIDASQRLLAGSRRATQWYGPSVALRRKPTVAPTIQGQGRPRSAARRAPVPASSGLAAADSAADNACSCQPDLRASTARFRAASPTARGSPPPDASVALGSGQPLLVQGPGCRRRDQGHRTSHTTSENYQACRQPLPDPIAASAPRRSRRLYLCPRHAQRLPAASH
jgi:hypothetical protein